MTGDPPDSRRLPRHINNLLRLDDAVPDGYGPFVFGCTADFLPVAPDDILEQAVPAPAGMLNNCWPGGLRYDKRFHIDLGPWSG